MKIVIAPDSFKGSMSSVDAANSIEKGVLRAFPETETILLPVGDGGEGTLDTLVAATKGYSVSVYVKGPLGDMVEAEYGILGDGETCVIEMAKASGLGLVPPSEDIGVRLNEELFSERKLLNGYLVDEDYRWHIQQEQAKVIKRIQVM